ncbi:MAG: IS630 family transposase [Tepidisphaeraceae bacterium]
MARMVLHLPRVVKRRVLWLRRSTSDKGLSNRCQMVLLGASGHGRAAIAESVGCSVSWVDRVLGRFRCEGESGLLDHREDNGTTKLDERYLWTLSEVIDHSPGDYAYPRPTWTQELLVKVMHRLTGVKVHVGTMSRALQQIGARRGRPRPTVGCPWSRRAKNRRLLMIRRALDTLPADQSAVYLDEVDIHLNPKIGFDWMNKGTQKQVLTPGQNCKRYLCGTREPDNGRIEYVVGDRKNSLLFIRMLQRLLVVYAGAKLIHVVLDNFKIHSSKQVQAWLTENGARLRLHFLPPYCPNDNKIERLWLDLHANVTRNHRCGSIQAAKGTF